MKDSNKLSALELTKIGFFLCMGFTIASTLIQLIGAILMALFGYYPEV